MIPRNLLSANSRLCLFAAFAIAGFVAFGQMKPKKNPLESFLDTQFWLGLRMGTNVSVINPVNRFSAFSPIGYDADSLQKTYSNYSLLGGHMGIEMNFYHRGFSISFQPAYKVSRFSYTGGNSWEGTQQGTRYELNFTSEQKIDMVELPLVIKADIIRKGKVRPFVMGGSYYSIVTAAQKKLTTTQTDFSAGVPVVYEGISSTVGVSNGFRNFAGWSAGGGVNLDFWNIRTIIEVGYQSAFTPMTRPEVVQNEFVTIGDRNDELKLKQLNFSIGLVFPFRYIDQTFKPY